MALALDPEYNKMLCTPGMSVTLLSSHHLDSQIRLSSLDGQCREAIGSLQKQIDFHFGEIRRLKYARNSRAYLPISRLPDELLSGVFIYVVESSLQNGDADFATGTFNFLLVCRHWNEVAVGCPLLWVWLVAGAVEAWPLFESRSKDAPLCLTWGPQFPDSARGILMDAKTPGRIRQLNFNGTKDNLEDLIVAFKSNPPSNVSSIRLQINPLHCDQSKHLARFFSSAFPKLSKLDIENSPPGPLSPAFTTSNLTALRLRLPNDDKRRHTLSQFSQILQRHPNLRELDLQQGGIPQPKPSPSKPLVPFVLSQLANLRLYGAESDIMGFINLIGMSSPLHDVDIFFEDTTRLAVPVLTGTVKKILAAYYGCPGLDYPRTVTHTTISSDSKTHNLVFDARSHPTSNLKLEFDRVGNEVIEKIFTLFPLDRVQEFTGIRLGLLTDDWHGMLLKMENLSHLQLENLDIRPVLDALDPDDRCAYGEAAGIILNHLCVHRWSASGGRPWTPIIDALRSWHRLRYRRETIGHSGTEARAQYWLGKLGCSILPRVQR